MRRKTRIALLVALAAFFAAGAAAQAEEIVKLKNGRTLVGTIEERDAEGFWIRTEIGRMRVEQADVADVSEVTGRRREAEGSESGNEGDEGSGAEAGSAKGADAVAAKAKGDEESEKARAQIIREVMTDLASKDEIHRRRAAGTILSGWPETSYLADAALAHRDRRVRLAIVRVLDESSVEDPRSYFLRALNDKDVLVQVMAVRALRHDKAKGVETHLVRALGETKPWPVHQEVLRTLEEVGTFRCLKTVMKSLEKTEDQRRLKAHTRVLKVILNVDHGKDVVAWRKAVDEYRPPLPGRGPR